MVLIETLWNVKYNQFHYWRKFLFRINRNIVECKGKYRQSVAVGVLFVLIETLWNVKRRHQYIVVNQKLSINRNIVECKESSS